MIFDILNFAVLLLSLLLQLLKYRSEQPFFKGTSFQTISAFGSNAAIIHYTPTPETDATILTNNLYLGKKERQKDRKTERQKDRKKERNNLLNDHLQ
jgi:hypothetical protein